MHPVNEQRHTDTARFMFGTAGIIALVVGLLILIWPGKSAVAVMAIIAAMVGIWSIINGVIYIGSAIYRIQPVDATPAC